MATIGKLWAGRIYGTNTGNLFLEFDSTEGELTGTLRFLDRELGPCVYAVTGRMGETLRLEGEPRHAAPNVQLGRITAEARLTPDGTLRGTWASEIGTGGTFEAFPHDTLGTDERKSAQPQSPEQIFYRTISVGFVRLFADDVERLIDDIGKDFNTQQCVVTYSTGEVRATKYSAAFLSDAKDFDKLSYLRLMIQEPDAHGIFRMADIELNAHGANEIRVQGINQSWVTGKAETLASAIRRYESPIATTYKRHGLNINSVVFLGMLVVMPSIPDLERRALFAGAVLLLLGGLYLLHGRFIPNALIQMQVRRPSFWVRVRPSIVSWLLAATAALAAGWLLAKLK